MTYRETTRAMRFSEGSGIQLRSVQDKIMSVVDEDLIFAMKLHLRDPIQAHIDAYGGNQARRGGRSIYIMMKYALEKRFGKERFRWHR